MCTHLRERLRKRRARWFQAPRRYDAEWMFSNFLFSSEIMMEKLMKWKIIHLFYFCYFHDSRLCHDAIATTFTFASCLIYISYALRQCQKLLVSSLLSATFHANAVCSYVTFSKRNKLRVCDPLNASMTHRPLFAKRQRRNDSHQGAVVLGEMIEWTIRCQRIREDKAGCATW